MKSHCPDLPRVNQLCKPAPLGLVGGNWVRAQETVRNRAACSPEQHSCSSSRKLKPPPNSQHIFVLLLGKYRRGGAPRCEPHGAGKQASAESAGGQQLERGLVESGFQLSTPSPSTPHPHHLQKPTQPGPVGPCIFPWKIPWFTLRLSSWVANTQHTQTHTLITHNHETHTQALFKPLWVPFPPS